MGEKQPRRIFLRERQGALCTALPFGGGARLWRQASFGFVLQKPPEEI